ncbi:hypothetical protein M378DRAFT_753015 [Amanita muscaria Koide BX008]|uniref:Secreted protein n=1 Tax=Amanita muscaria (strain Koide BX008) TaxID=946122 RepID=A0A0C2RWD5_AMAMK|nr:hypothetical protein M378DRAFT_753015 [Amanita muscaria Koide BX008]
MKILRDGTLRSMQLLALMVLGNQTSSMQFHSWAENAGGPLINRATEVLRTANGRTEQSRKCNEQGPCTFWHITLQKISNSRSHRVVLTRTKSMVAKRKARGPCCTLPFPPLR